MLSSQIRAYGARRGYATYLIYGLTIAVLLIFAKAAFAAPPRDQEWSIGESYSATFAACDTRDQLEAVMTLDEADGVDAARAFYQALQQTPNSSGEPTCGMVQGTWRFMERGTRYTFTRNGEAYDAWSVRIYSKANQREFWAAVPGKVNIGTGI